MLLPRSIRNIAEGVLHIICITSLFFLRIKKGFLYKMKKNFYAVKCGRKTGIFSTWQECREQIDGFSGAQFKGFEKHEDALCYLNSAPKEDASLCEAVAYTDGSFLLSENKYSFGVVFFKGDEKLEFSKSFEDADMAQMRNVAGEISGAAFAMDYCLKNNISSLEIRYDYEGVEKWCTGEWQTNRQGTTEYAEFYNKIKNKLHVVFTKVKGHSGDKYNDRADALAKAALGIV